jgi:hypothetical protein
VGYGRGLRYPEGHRFLKFQKINLGWKLTLPAMVGHCFHALALDERRESFRPTRVAASYEVWFRGVHSDVGGGNGNLKLNDIALAWMLRKALAVGVPVDAAIAAALSGDAAAPVSHNRDPRADPFRKVLGRDWIHHTITIRNEPERCQNPPATCPRETLAFEATRTTLVV